ncbi:hypothetical protein E6C60_3616 [Paenibacillus algicola]|uniref:Unsaturated rhamnogalacturonyl hydrolase n=1 Tax=Paenibacillus algicola TaxID=2565926 RepID=A0A4P8XN88_9BACL|nr:glycoside hydrolase family 88 protein [Paenibacillus algicola]QCT04326.1 hypothetical protein E6C60_3616 [Paenibacillus algicola]
MNTMEQSQLLERLLHRVEGIESDVWRLRMDFWEWNSGVCLFGIIKAYEATGEKKYLSFLSEWYDRNVEQRKTGSVNTVIPANVALLLLKETGDAKYAAICEEYADWCLNVSLKTTNGGLAHVWSEGGLEDYKNQLWIDSLFMAGLFMLRYGAWSRNEKLLAAGKEQFDIHIRSQFDPEAGLFYHGYHCLEQKPLGEFWGRGNGWAAASLIELIENQGVDSEEGRYVEVFQRLMEKGYQLRLKDGMLRTLPELEEAYPEATATALFGYAALKGVRLGILEHKFEAWGRQTTETLAQHVSEEGIPQSASGGTDCQEKEGYLQVPYTETLYAYGVLFMLYGEAIKLTEESQETADV